ncbi:protein crumbs-like [Ptychodera flava]|uniref:protein crumbs-like n=1 Tax=Ptychodera flava TaxID=63121 RepID=UPI00396A22B3
MAGVRVRSAVRVFLVCALSCCPLLQFTLADCDVTAAPPENGYFIGNPASVVTSDLLRIECNENYTLAGTNAFYCAGTTGFIPSPLESNLPKCHENCLHPGVPSLGSLQPEPTQSYGTYAYSEVVVFTCDPDTLIEGSTTITCTEGGQWTNSRPICHQNCDDPGAPKNGQQRPGGTLIHGGQVGFTCDDGRSPVGRNPITCQDGVWSDPLPHCSVVIIIDLQLTVTSGSDLVTGRINNATINFQATSSSLAIDVIGTGLWKISTFTVDGTGTAYELGTPELTSEQENQPLPPGGNLYFNDIEYSVDGDAIPCTDDIQICAMLFEGDSANPDFDLVRLGGDNMTACQPVSCDVNECLNASSCPWPNQECENLPGSFNCSCVPGYQGDDCQILIDNCASNPCQHAAPCRNRVNHYVCECWPGYEGVHCENQTDFCKNSVCQNNATCETLLSGFQCLCQPGYQGDMCESTIPYFTECPAGETKEIILPPGSSSVFVNVSHFVAVVDWLQRPLEVESSDPSIILPGAVEFSEDFQSGKTITLRSTDDNENSASCSFVIKLLDMEIPEIHCPENTTIETYKERDHVTWPPVVATDNVGLHPTDPVSYSMQNGSEVTADGRPHLVTASAKDSSENTASCDFNVTLVRVEKPPSEKDASMTTIIAVSAVGSIAFICIIVIIGLLLCYQRRERKKRKYWKTMSGQSGHPTTGAVRNSRDPLTFQNAAYEKSD